jgi:hypothetical protein
MSGLLGAPLEVTPPVKYRIYDGDRDVVLGECPSIAISGSGVIVVTLHGFEQPALAPDDSLSPAALIDGLGTTLDLFDELRHELTERGWQPDTAESITADVAKMFLSNVLKKAIE